MNNEEQLRSMVNVLVGLGEDSTELRFWERVFPSLDAAAQAKLIALLGEETAALENEGPTQNDVPRSGDRQIVG